MKRFSKFIQSALLVGYVLATGLAHADRVKDLTTLASQRPNQLIGYGLVVGLQGTGDDASVPFTVQSMKAMLAQMGVRIDGPLTDFETATSAARVDIKNSAAVLVTAELPGFAKPGQRIDVNVSAIGKASNLRGGSLVMTALRGVDGEIYAIAQGALTATGIDAAAAMPITDNQPLMPPTRPAGVHRAHSSQSSPAARISRLRPLRVTSGSPAISAHSTIPATRLRREPRGPEAAPASRPCQRSSQGVGGAGAGLMPVEAWGRPDYRWPQAIAPGFATPAAVRCCAGTGGGTPAAPG